MTKTGRNDPCPCGSGKKYKRCCCQKDEAAASAAPTLPSRQRSRTTRLVEAFEKELAFGDEVNKPPMPSSTWSTLASLTRRSRPPETSSSATLRSTTGTTA
jgi:hypothetical protein